MKLKTNNGNDTDRVRRFLKRGSLRTVLTYLTLGLLLAIAVVLAGREIEQHITAIESWIADLGPWGAVAFVLLFAVATSLLVPDTVLCVMAGALFGMAEGATVIITGILLAATLQFTLARRFLRAKIEQILLTKPSLAAIQRAVIRDELRLQVLLRLTPLNPATVNYVLGAAGVRFGGFLLACLALIPSLIIEVYFGHAGKHMARLAGSGTGADRLENMAILGGAIAGIVVIVFVSRMAHKAVMQAVAESNAARAATDSSVE